MKRYLVDTNIILRFLLQDNPGQQKIANELFNAAQVAEVTLVILPEILAECVYVLESFYKIERGDIAQHLITIIESLGIEISDTQVHVEALKHYAKTRMNYIDCVLAATSTNYARPVASFDKVLSKHCHVVLKA